MLQDSVIKKGKSKKSKGDKRRWIPNTFHVDLANAHEGEEYWLHANGRRYDLAKHTKASIAKAKAQSPRLRKIPDHKMTHYTKDTVLLPHDQVMRIHIKHSLKTFDNMKGESVAHHAHIHVPPKKYRGKKKLGALTDDDTVPVPDGANPPPMQHGHIDWIGTAKALIFHHGDLFTHDPDTAAIIFDYMDEEQSAYIYSLISNSATASDGLPSGLADRMEYYGAPTDTSGWARQEAVKIYDRETDANGDPIVDENGNYVYSTTDYETHYKVQPVQEIMKYAGAVFTQMMIATKNDTQLQNLKWTQETGSTVDDTTTTQSVLASVELQGDDWTPKLARTDTHDGMKCSITVHDADLRQIQVDVENSYVRYMGLYVSFFDAEGNRMDLSNVNYADRTNEKWWPNESDWSFQTSNLGSTLGFEYDNYRYLATISPQNTLMAIPITPPGSTSVYLTFPEDAVKVEVYGCGLGTGANPFPLANIAGGTLTCINNFAVPAYLLGFAVAAQSYKPLYDALYKEMVIIPIAALGVGYYTTDIAVTSVNNNTDWNGVTSFSQTIFSTVCSKILEWCEKQIAEGELKDQIPFSGWIMTAIDIATGIAQMAETIIEVATSPWAITNSISTTVTSSLTLHPDPRSGIFPQAPYGSTRSCVAKLIYANENRETISMTVDVDADFTGDTLQFTFPENTLGGSVKFEVDFYIDNWLAGRALTTFMDNDESHTENVNLYLVEIPIPITSKSIYGHSQLLIYQDDQYVWKSTGVAPTTTIANANNDNSGNAISEWVGLALSQRYGTLGLSWKSYGTGLTDASSGAGNTQLYAFQNVDIPGKTMSDAKFTTYGFSGQSSLVYDVYPPKFEMDNGQWVLDSNNQPVPDPDSVDLGDYYLDPRKASDDISDGGGYHLRKVSVTGSSDFDPNSSPLLSYGRFQFFPDHICIHPSGYVIGVSQKYGKIMILELQATATEDDQVPLARSFAGTATNPDRPGLLFRPIAVSCSYDGTIFILDSISASNSTYTRIQAFDLKGRPVNNFYDTDGNPNPFLDLPNDVTYLDMVAVGNKKMTYLYVLYYTNKGSDTTDYNLAIYQYGETAPESNPLVTTNEVPAARLQVDMWHTMYTLNYEMTTDGSGNPAGPSGTNVGPYGRTVPSVSAWLPPVPDSNS